MVSRALPSDDNPRLKERFFDVYHLLTNGSFSGYVSRLLTPLQTE